MSIDITKTILKSLVYKKNRHHKQFLFEVNKRKQHTTNRKITRVRTIDADRRKVSKQYIHEIFCWLAGKYCRPGHSHYIHE